MRRRLCLVAVVGSLVLTGCGADATSDPAPSYSGRSAPTSQPVVREAASDQAIEKALDPSRPGCSAAVGVEGTVVWTGARGLADLAAGTPITADTVFDVASVSKQFTAGAVLLLEQDGRLSQDDTLAEHLTGLPPWAADTPIGSMMRHTSGIPDHFALADSLGVVVAPDARVSQEQVLAFIAGITELTAKRGSYEYSNSNYVLLAEVVRVVSGLPLPEFLAQRFFGPLDLAMTMDPTAAVAGRATPYRRDDTVPAGFTAQDYQGWAFYGDGGILTTPSELVRWADNYRTGRIGGREFLDAQVAEPARDRDEGYGAGIVVLSDGALVHGGLWMGYYTEFAVSADRRTAVAVSCNAELPRSLDRALLKIWG